MGVGEPSTAKVRHGIVFPPNNIIEHPVAQILQRRADPKDVMIASNDPKRSVGLKHPAGSSQPIPAELIIGGKTLKLIPVIVNGIYWAPNTPRLLTIPDAKSLLTPVYSPWMEQSKGMTCIPIILSIMSCP